MLIVVYSIVIIFLPLSLFISSVIVGMIGYISLGIGSILSLIKLIIEKKQRMRVEKTNIKYVGSFVYEEKV